MSHATRASKKEAGPASTVRARAKDSPIGLWVGKSDDAFEQEADRAADRMAGPDWSFSRMSVTSPKNAIDDGGVGTPSIVHDVLRSRGQPLDPGTRAFFEPRFGRDFNRVRIHADAHAAASARAVNALAYAVGQHIVLGSGPAAMNVAAKRRLLAHELAHTVQQGEATVPSFLPVTDAASTEERAAEAASRNLAAALPPGALARTGIQLARQPDENAAAPRGTGLPTFGNLLGDEPDPRSRKKRVELFKKDDVWFERDKYGERKAHGEYNFVVQNGRIWANKRPFGHKDAALGQRVAWAGQMSFGGKTKKGEENTKAAGKLNSWSNESGHFGPVSGPKSAGGQPAFAEQAAKAAGLPMDLYRPGQFLDSKGNKQIEKGPQLPVFQPEKGEVLVPRGSGDPPKTPQTHLPSSSAQKSPPSAKAPAEGTTPPAVAAPSTLPTHHADVPAGPDQHPSHAHATVAPAAPGVDTSGKTPVKKPAEATDVQPTPHPEEHKELKPTKATAPGVVAAPVKPHPSSTTGADVATTPPITQVKTPAPPKPASPASAKTPSPSELQRPPVVPSKVQAEAGAKPAVVPIKPAATKPPAAPVPATPHQATKDAKSPTNVAPPIKPAATKPPAASVPAAPHQATKEAKSLTSAAPPIKPAATKPPAASVAATSHPATKQSKPPTAAAPPSPAPHHDEQENGPAPTKERSHYVQHGGSIIAGPDKLGAAGSLGAGATQSHGHGLQTSQSVDFGGQVVTNVEEVPDTSPPQYRVSLMIDLSAGGSVGASREGGLGGSLSGSASGSLKMSVTHVMTGDAKDKYLNAIKTGQGGASEELRVAQMVAKGSIEEAKAYLGHRKSLGGSAAAAKQMAEGDEVTLSAGGKLEANAGVSGSKSGGGSSLGVGVGFSTSGELTRSQARKDGKILITLAATSSKGMSVGGSVSEGVAGMGVSHEDARSKGKSVTLALDPNAPDFDALYAEVLAASTVEDLDRLAVRRANLAGSTTTSRGTSSADTTSASVGFLSVTGKDAHAYSEEEIRDAGGVSHRYEGSNSSGASLAVAGRDVAASKTTDQFAATVGPDNTATGETSSATSETDYLGSINKLGASYDKRPVGTTAGVVTGGTKALQEKSEIQGKKLTNDSFSRLAELAKDPGAWQKSWHGTVDTFVDWEATRKKVLAANGDRNLISKAMAEFESHGSGRSQTVENAVSETGIAFDFPEELIDQKPAFDQLVAGDLFAHPRELAGAGRPQDAIAELNADNEKLGKMLTGVQMHQDSVKNPAALGEMMRRISGKRTAIRAEIRKLSPRPAAAPAGDARGGATPDKAAAVDPAAQAAQQEALAKREERNAKINDLIPSLLTNRDKERANFAAINEEFKKEESWFSKPDSAVIADKLNQLKPLYDQWEKSLAELRAVYTERGDSPDRANQFAPNRAEWNALYNKAFH